MEWNAGRGIRTDGFESRKKARRRIIQAGLVPQEALKELIQECEEIFPLREVPESLGKLSEVLELDKLLIDVFVVISRIPVFRRGNLERLKS